MTRVDARALATRAVTARARATRVDAGRGVAPRWTRTRARADDDASETREDVFFHARPALDDAPVLAGDVASLWTCALVERVGAVSADPAFGGWLAPVEISSASAAAFAAQTAWALSSWVFLSATLANAYKIDDDVTPSVGGAARETTRAWCAWAPLQAVERVLAHWRGVDGDSEFSVLTSTLVALGVLLGWRCYAKVFSLLAPSRNESNRERDDAEWEEFFRLFGGVGALSLACALGELVYYGRGL